MALRSPSCSARPLALAALWALASCASDDQSRDAVALTDARAEVPTATDALLDASAPDAVQPEPAPDASLADAALDAVAPPESSLSDALSEPSLDAALDALPDAPIADVRAPDAPPADAAREASAGGCVSGAPGSLAVRFSWTGSGPGSTASVRYEVNQLPDTSSWTVTANSMSIGYRPVFDDTFLGPGGLVLEGTGFLDVRTSTVGLASLSRVTLSLYGRSFNTTASGSFSWRTFDGMGASPPNLVANSTPYQWYATDVSTGFRVGNAGTLLRIYPGPSSGSLIVNRVELCFEAR